MGFEPGLHDQRASDVLWFESHLLNIYICMNTNETLKYRRDPCMIKAVEVYDRVCDDLGLKIVHTPTRDQESNGDSNRLKYTRTKAINWTYKLFEYYGCTKWLKMWIKVHAFCFTRNVFWDVRLVWWKDNAGKISRKLVFWSSSRNMKNVSSPGRTDRQEIRKHVREAPSCPNNQQQLNNENY